jgi:hypothetical protein
MAARVLHLLVLASALLPATVAMPSQSPRAEDERGLTGYVLSPDGVPVSGGSVALQSVSGRVSAEIDRTGRFRLAPDREGLHKLSLSLPGLTPYLLYVTVPPSRTLKLPVIRLRPASYLRMRFVSAAGDVIVPPWLRRQTLDARGVTISESPDLPVADYPADDGTVTVGPLPLGRSMLALDTPAFAQTRVPDVIVTDGGQLLDGGTVVVQPGAVLHVDVVDEAGAPLSAHEVSIEDAPLVSPLRPRLSRTNQQGRATFDRLAAGRYRLRTSTAGPCVRQRLSVARIVSVPGTGALHTRLVVGGTATFRFTTPLGPLVGVVVLASPNPDLSPGMATPFESLERTAIGTRPLRPLASRSTCNRTTDAEGRVSFPNFPPGPARIDVRFPDSTYVRLVTAPDDGTEMTVHVAQGFLPLRVTAALRNEPVAGAVATWTGGGARVEGRTGPDGHALLEGVGATGGTLEVTARGYEPSTARLAEAPATLHEVVLRPAPPLGLMVRVVTASGEPVANAVVEVTLESPMAIGHVAATDAKGVARFLTEAPAGPLVISASADRFVTATARVQEDGRGDIVLTLSRGYRVLAEVAFPAEAGVQQVRVLNEAGESVDAFLDLASDRNVPPAGRLSLGPLPPGAYVVELLGASGRHEERLEIVDRDVSVTFK